MYENQPVPYPGDPLLAEAARAINETGHWGAVVDAHWNLVYMSDALRSTFGASLSLVPVPLGAHYFGSEALALSTTYLAGANTADFYLKVLRGFGPWVLGDTPGGRDELRGLVAEPLRSYVDGLHEDGPESVIHFVGAGTHITGAVNIPIVGARVRDDSGLLAGTMIIHKPAASTNVLGALSASGDLRHLERMQRVAKAGRRAAAVLFADLEASTPLARRMPTASYFQLGRRLTREADRCVVEHAGIVGRHVGDGIVAFFLADDAGSESAAARGCIEAARELRTVADDVAVRSGLQPGELVLRFGLHWGATLYVGQILTAGRSEVTALGDAVNETARIEACASGGLALASKELLERLDESDARALGLDTADVSYTPLGELPGATEKARRDAPAIGVCAV